MKPSCNAIEIFIHVINKLSTVFFFFYRFTVYLFTFGGIKQFISALKPEKIRYTLLAFPLPSLLRAMVFLVLTLPVSCIIMIGENDYRALGQNSKDRISEIDGVFPELRDSAVLLYEVNASQLLEQFRKDSYNVIRFWRPYCENEHCRDVSAEQALADSFAIKMYLISETYDLEQIELILKTSGYKLPVFVPSDRLYGHKLTPTRKQFFAELTGEESLELVFMDYLLFKGDQLLCSDKTIEDIKYYLNNK